MSERLVMKNQETKYMYVSIKNYDGNVKQVNQLKSNMFDLFSMLFSAGKSDKADSQCPETRGVRSISISYDGQHMASGDRVGNIR